MTGGGEVDADLVGPARGDAHLDERRGAAPLDHPRVALGGPAGGIGSEHPVEPRAGHRANRHPNHGVVPGGGAGDERAVDLGHAVRAPGRGHRGGGPRRARAEHEARRETPEAMRRGHLAVARREEPEERVLQEAARRHRGQPRGLVDHEQIRVLVNHGEGGRHVGFVPRRTLPHHQLTGRDDGVARRGHRVERELAVGRTLPPDRGGRVGIAGRQQIRQRTAVVVGAGPEAIRPAAIARHACQAAPNRRA